MARPRKPAPASGTPTPTPATPTSPARGFPRRSGGQGSELTSATIAADLDAYRKAGGEIEVLGVTRTLHKIAEDAERPDPAK